ncbi:MAG: hypothetical protein AB7G93_02330 [Bdellovibrionales bacterium]
MKSYLQYDSYRSNFDLFKILLSLSVIALKFLLVAVQIGLALH